MQQLADSTLRTEVSIKARKLLSDFGHRPTVAQLTPAYLADLAELEVTRTLREGNHMRTVRTHEEVKTRLHEVYSHKPETARNLFGTWLQLAALGENVTKQGMPPRSFYRHRKQLQDAGCAWHGSDIGVVEGLRLVPADFTPRPGDLRHLAAEDPLITELLTPYRAA